MFFALYLLTISSSILWNSCNSAYHKGAADRIRMKFLALDLELLKDMVVKIRGVQHFKESYYRSTPYQVGEILCNIRHLLSKMVTLYKRIKNGSYSNKEKQAEKFLEVHSSWFEIDHLLRMMEIWEGKKSVSNLGDMLRMGGDEEASKRWQVLDEGDRLDNVRSSLANTTTTSIPLATFLVSKRKNKVWHAAVSYDITDSGE